MPYCDPNDVTSPKSNWTLGRVIFNGGPGSWSVAEGIWDGEPAIGMRWNGEHDASAHGSPQSRGYPTWFIVPSEMESAAKSISARLSEERKGIVCEVTSPSNYEPGAWKVEIRLTGTMKKNAGNMSFPPPKVPGRTCISDAEHRAAVPSADGSGLELWGKFVDGVWKGHFYIPNLPFKTDSVGDEIRVILIEAVNRQFTDTREPNIGH